MTGTTSPITTAYLALSPDIRARAEEIAGSNRPVTWPEVLLMVGTAIAASRWQPIETAPKDGTPILLTGGNVDYGERYDEEAFRPPCVVGWWDRYGWRFCSYDSGCYGDYSGPTHWQSLLPSPKPAAVSEGGE